MTATTSHPKPAPFASSTRRFTRYAPDAMPRNSRPSAVRTVWRAMITARGGPWATTAQTPPQCAAVAEQPPPAPAVEVLGVHNPVRQRGVPLVDPRIDHSHGNVPAG